MKKIFFALLFTIMGLGIINLGTATAQNIDLSANIAEKYASNQSISTDKFVNLTIRSDEDYYLKFSAEYKDSSSSSWSPISDLTSSVYFSDYSNIWSNGYYNMRSSDHGVLALKNLVKFKKHGYYKITVQYYKQHEKDVSGKKSSVLYSVAQNSSVNSDLNISMSPSNPDTEEWVKITINTDYNYVGRINFTKFQYRSSTSDSRSNISRTSSTYVSNYSSQWSNGYYNMTSSDHGERTISNFIKFKKKGFYRIIVQDSDGNIAYVQVSVEPSNSNSDLELSVSPSSPDTNEWVKLKIETDDDYVGKINFTKFQYKSSSSDSRSSISRTSSTYVSDYSTEWSNGYYRMTSSDDGEKTISKFIKFKKKGYYRIVAEDTDGNVAYVQINVDVSSSSSSDDITLSTNKKSPSTNQFVNLTIETDDDYVGKLTFSAKYRSTSSSSWMSISNLTSSTYFSDYSDEWEDGYYKMKSSDDGEKTLKNIVKFKKKGYYRIYVKDTDGNQNYIQFAVGVSSSSSSSNIYPNAESEVDGFTNLELSKVKETYESWNSMIAQMQRQYPHLKKSTYWKTLSNNFYNDMKDVVRNKSPRDFDDYDDFKSAFDDWYEYTMRNV